MTWLYNIRDIVIVKTTSYDLHMRRATPFIIITFIVLAGFLFLKQSKVPQSQTETQLSSMSPVATASAVVNASINYLCSAGETVFEGLQSNASDVQFKQYSFGKLVTSINGQEQGDNKYWLYKVDQKEASSSADTYRCKGGEQIFWELK